ncbi:unnamed protein product [Amoebophrya sp. A120]|nr:unnamed protein product [Amoebophrya sp. A120]|eukprot:GSA120T00009732001.1
MEDRAGKSTVSVRNQLQYFNGLGEHVVSTGFLQVLEDAKRKTTPRVGMTKKPCPHDKWADDRKPEDACECDGVNYFVRWADFHTYYKCYESCSALGEGRKED